MIPLNEHLERLAAVGDRDAAAVLLEDERDAVVRFVRRRWGHRLGDHFEAEAVVGDVLDACARRADAFYDGRLFPRGRPTTREWLMIVCEAALRQRAPAPPAALRGGNGSE